MTLEQLELTVDYFEFDKQFYQQLKATPLNNPFLISYNKKAFDLIELDYDEATKEAFISFINGEKILKGSVPYAMAYAGHQFGYFVPQLANQRFRIDTLFQTRRWASGVAFKYSRVYYE
jgi:uncharacterized protein YdiU (UPF0061 family)